MQIAVRPVNQIFYLLKDVEISLHYMCDMHGPKKNSGITIFTT